ELLLVVGRLTHSVRHHQQASRRHGGLRVVALVEAAAGHRHDARLLVGQVGAAPRLAVREACPRAFSRSPRPSPAAPRAWLRAPPARAHGVPWPAPRSSPAPRPACANAPRAAPARPVSTCRRECPPRQPLRLWPSDRPPRLSIAP